jgi:hypothetical protein
MTEPKEPIEGVSVMRRCWHCQGKGNRPGGQREYGELVKCEICHGARVTGDWVTLAEFRELILESPRWPTT